MQNKQTNKRKTENKILAKFTRANQTKNLSLHLYKVNTKSSGKRNALILSTMKPILRVSKENPKKASGIQTVRLCKRRD